MDGKPATILAEQPGVIIAMQPPASSALAASVWTFAIQVGLEKIVAAEVNVWGSLEPELQGVKGRVTALDCTFQKH